MTFFLELLKFETNNKYLLESTMYWLKLCDLIFFHSLCSSLISHLTCPKILFFYPTKRSNMKDPSAPANQEASKLVL